MAVLSIPPIEAEEQQPRWDYDVELEGVVYRVRLTWSERLQRWRIDLLDTDGAAIYNGRLLDLGITVGLRLQDTRIPRGLIFTFALDKSGLQCGYDDLGSRCPLVYVEEETIPPDPVPPGTPVTIELVT